MAALDNLNAQQFYHASPHRMARGTVMTPETNAAHGSNFEMSTGNSYLTTNRQTAALMGELAASKVTNTRYEAWGKVGSPGTPPKRVSPKMYDVRPEGHIFPDENLGGEGSGHDSYETRDPVTVLGRHIYTPPGEPGSLESITLANRRSVRQRQAELRQKQLASPARLNPNLSAAPQQTLEDRLLGRSPREPDDDSY